MFDPALVRRTCGKLATEHDSRRARELVLLLDAIARDNQEEVQERLKYLAKRYKYFLEDGESHKQLLENGAA